MADGRATGAIAEGTGAAVGAAGVGATIGGAVAAGGAGGSAAGPVGTVVGAAIGALVGVGTVIARRASANKAERTGVNAQNRVNQAYYEYNKESEHLQDEYNTRALATAKNRFAKQQDLTRKRMAMKEEQVREKAKRQDASIKNSILMSHRSAPASSVARADRNILKLEMDNGSAT